MLRRLLPVFFVLSALFLFACARTVAPPTNDAGPGTVAKPTATTAAVPPAGGAIGVPECDDYLAKYDACVSGKVPEIARAQYKATLEQARKSYQQAALTPQGKATLAATCKQAAEQARAAFKSYNCTF